MYQSRRITKTEILVVNHALRRFADDLQREIRELEVAGLEGDDSKFNTLEFVQSMISILEDDYEFVKYPEWP